MGVHLHIDGVAGENLGMGGAGGALRIRPIPELAIDVGAGLYGGTDYNGLDRVELPISVTTRLYFNPQHRVQFYGLLQAGASFSHAEGQNTRPGMEGVSVNRDYAHVGGAAGVGLEWRVGRAFALNLDVRGFVRHRVDGNPQPEFTELTDSGWQSTDLSGGVSGQAGMTFYWGM